MYNTFYSFVLDKTECNSKGVETRINGKAMVVVVLLETRREVLDGHNEQLNVLSHHNF